MVRQKSSAPALFRSLSHSSFLPQSGPLAPYLISSSTGGFEDIYFHQLSPSSIIITGFLQMADPFSLAASVIGVATAAFGISKKLHDLVQDFRDAPKQFEILADQIERDAILLKCSVELVQDHEALFKDELKGLLRDINGQFANINGLVGKLLPKSRHRRRDRFHNMVRILWHSKKLTDIMVQLEGLRSTLSLIVGIAQYAEKRSSR